MSAKSEFMKRKMHEIATKGVRRNTHAPVSASNKRRSVAHNQAIAIALSEARKATPKMATPRQLFERGLTEAKLRLKGIKPSKGGQDLRMSPKDTRNLYDDSENIPYKKPNLPAQAAPQRADVRMPGDDQFGYPQVIPTNRGDINMGALGKRSTQSLVDPGSQAKNKFLDKKRKLLQS